MIEKPSKEQVREWLKSQIASNEPPPSNERIRELLSWKMVQKK